MKSFLVLTSAAVLLAAAVVLPVGASAPRLDAEALSVGSGPGRAVRLSERRSAEARDRDKTGTSGVREIIEGPQPVDLQEVTGLRSLLPERGGFRVRVGASLEAPASYVRNSLRPLELRLLTCHYGYSGILTNGQPDWHTVPK